MPRPKTFSFLGKEWKIRYRRTHTDGKGSVGLTDFERYEIDVFTKGHTVDGIKDTLLHELLHVTLNDPVRALYHPDTFMPTSRFEEELILQATPRIHSLFKENPKLTEYLFTNEE